MSTTTREIYVLDMQFIFSNNRVQVSYSTRNFCMFQYFVKQIDKLPVHWRSVQRVYLHIHQLLFYTEINNTGT